MVVPFAGRFSRYFIITMDTRSFTVQTDREGRGVAHAGALLCAATLRHEVPAAIIPI
jgi:hypothetical protein